MIALSCRLIEQDSNKGIFEIANDSLKGKVVLVFPARADFRIALSNGEEAQLVLPENELATFEKQCLVVDGIVGPKKAMLVRAVKDDSNLLQRIEGFSGLVIQPRQSPFKTMEIPNGHPWREVICPDS